jgi:hypothetical protein
MSSSMRGLRRRLLTWRRYADRTYWNPRVSRPHWMGKDPAMSPGHVRAWDAFLAEEERRAWAETQEVWLGGPEGEAALLVDVLGEPTAQLNHTDSGAVVAPVPGVAQPHITKETK